jgi:hypothetical protein
LILYKKKLRRTEKYGHCSIVPIQGVRKMKERRGGGHLDVLDGMGLLE